MTERPRAADDSDAISRRITELKAERDAILGCSCTSSIDERGELVWLVDIACPLHHVPLVSRCYVDIQTIRDRNVLPGPRDYVPASRS